MKLTIKKKVDVNGWFLKVFLGNTKWWKNEPFVFNGKEYTNIDDFEKDYLTLVEVQPPYYSSEPKEGTKTVRFYIDLCTGEVPNWPLGVDFDFNNYKVVDTGRYEVRNQLGVLQAGYTGYVPDCLSIDRAGFGDYFQFRIENGRVCGWRFGQKDYDSIVLEDE